MRISELKRMATLVGDLNYHITDFIGEDSEHRFYYSTDGWDLHVIVFNETVLYNSENDIIDKGSSVREHVKKEFNNYINKISKAEF